MNITLYNHSRTDDKTFGRVVEPETGATIEFLETRLLLAKTPWCEILKTNTSLIRY